MATKVARWWEGGGGDGGADEGGADDGGDEAGHNAYQQHNLTTFHTFLDIEICKGCRKAHFFVQLYIH